MTLVNQTIKFASKPADPDAENIVNEPLLFDDIWFDDVSEVSPRAASVSKRIRKTHRVSQTEKLADRKVTRTQTRLWRSQKHPNPR